MNKELIKRHVHIMCTKGMHIMQTTLAEEN